MTSAVINSVIVEDLIVEIAKVHSCQLLLSWDRLVGDGAIDRIFNRFESEASRLEVASSVEARQSLALAIAEKGFDEFGMPAIAPRVMKMIECKDVVVHHLCTGLPLNELSEVRKAPNAWYMSSEDADKVRNALLTDRQRDVIDLKAKEGRYTLEEAAEFIFEQGELILLDDDIGDSVTVDYPEILKLLSDAAETKVLPVYKPGKAERYEYGTEVNCEARIYYEEALWSDLNQWLGEHLAHVRFRFSNPKAVPTSPKMPGVTKQEILAVEWNLPVGRKLKNSLDELSKWIEPALVSRGKPGGGSGGSHLWNPALLAICLFTTSSHKKWRVRRNALERVMERYFPEYLEEWLAGIEIVDSGS